jgi:hypothetical protein
VCFVETLVLLLKGHSLAGQLYFLGGYNCSIDKPYGTLVLFISNDRSWVYVSHLHMQEIEGKYLYNLGVNVFKLNKTECIP